MAVPVRHRPQTARRAGSGAPEHGYSLVEILVAVVIMGLVFVAVFSGIFAVLTASQLNRANADADFLARDYAEDLKSDRPGWEYRPCAAPSAYPTYTVPPKFPGWEVRITKIEYGNGGSPATWSAGCGGNDRGVQRITVTATTPDGRSHTSEQKVVVVKRDNRRDED